MGFSGGYTKNPTYKEVCTGMTGHAEVVRVVFDPNLVAFEDLLKVSFLYSPNNNTSLSFNMRD